MDTLQKFQPVDLSSFQVLVPVERESPSRSKIIFLRLLIVFGIIAIIYYFNWWLWDLRFQSPGLILLLIAAILYSGIQMGGNWYLYWSARHAPPSPPPSNDLSVDIFVTACGESPQLIRQALTAACKVNGPHQTWLLDDAADPALKVMAEGLGAGYIARKDHLHAKAGNINHALTQTSGDIVAIFDIDHVPTADYLSKTVGYFSRPEIGFVQVMLTFGNGHETWIAGAAMESSLEFYNPTYLGTEGVGGVTMMGSNSLIRRSALESIGGYQPGLAEDLATSIALHAQGWQSTYVAEPLAAGIAPPDLIAWFTQQLKWSRGVFELLITTYPKFFSRLTWGQRLSYAVRMTRYWIGPAIGLHLLATIAVLIFGSAFIRDTFHSYLNYLAPLAVMEVLIRTTAMRIWQHPKTPRTSLGKGIALVYSTWPIYLWTWIMAIFRIPLRFRPTPKTKAGSLNPVWLLPQIIALGCLLGGLLYTVLVGKHSPSLLLMFASAQIVLMLYFFSRYHVIAAD